MASAAARAMIDWSRTALKPPGYFAKTRPDNHASRHVLLKTGFAETGVTGSVLTYTLD